MARQRKFNRQQEWQMARLLGAVRWGQTWFKAPAPEVKLTAGRVAEIHDVPRHFLGEAPPSRFEDFAPQSQSSVDWLNQELKRPSSTLNQASVRIAGKPYHWTQTYDGVLRLAPGASPW